MHSKPPFVNRRQFVAVGALSLLTGYTRSGTSTESPPADGSDEQNPTNVSDEATPRTEQVGTEQSQQSQSTTVAVGEVVSGDNLSMVVRNVTSTESLGEFQEAGSGNTFIVVRMAVKNTSGGFIDFNSFLQARLKDSENTVYDAAFGVTDHPIQSGILADGEVARGDVVFEVPKDAEALEMQFDFSTFELFQFERVTVTLGEQASSVADLTQSLNVDVLSAGESATRGDVSVTVHGIRTATELGSVATAEEGKEYVIPDIEITNRTSEALTVSTALQMRVKTGGGLAYMADIAGSSQLEKGYSEGSPIASGDSRRGELAYQVATDTAPLYWTYNFLDMTDGYKSFWSLR